MTDDVDTAENTAGKAPDQKYMRVPEVLKSDILTEKEKTQLRYWIVNARPRINRKGYWVPGNDLNKALVRIGRLLLVDREMFLLWLKDFRECRDFHCMLDEKIASVKRKMRGMP